MPDLQYHLADCIFYSREESLNLRTRRCLEEGKATIVSYEYVCIITNIFTVRHLCREQHADRIEDFKGYVHICSRNNFPTAAGLASSAAGYACLGES